jgi:hypothetical protein
MTTLKLKTFWPQFNEMKSTDSPKPLYIGLFISSLVIGLGFLGFQKVTNHSSNKIENAGKLDEKLSDKKVNKPTVGEDNGVINDDDKNDDDEEDDDEYDDESEVEQEGIRGDYGVEDGPFKMVLCVNMSLSMGKGKMCAQCGHATLGEYTCLCLCIYVYIYTYIHIYMVRFYVNIRFCDLLP